MKKTLRAAAVAVSLLTTASLAQAAPFTPTFGDYAFPGSQFDVDGDANAFFEVNYGITVDNAYLYRDARDTFDGVGVANGEVSEIGTPQAGRINFLDTTDFVTIDYLAVLQTTYSAFGAGDILLDSFVSPDGVSVNGTFTLDAGPGVIAYVTFSSTGGYGTISGMSYNYDGTTDGRNNDLAPVPEPGTLGLMGAALVGCALIRRRAARRQ